MFEDQGDSSDFALNEMLEHIWQDAVAVCGIEMHRRVLSLHTMRILRRSMILRKGPSSKLET